MFLNSMYTDGYTCRISFCKEIHAAPPVNQTSLELHDFTSEEVDRYFRPCTVDPDRKDVFVSYHGNTVIRRLSSAEYYDMSGNVNRQKMKQGRKKRSNVEQIETQIPSPKTASIEHYTTHMTYMLQHMDVLSNSTVLKRPGLTGATTSVPSVRLRMQSTGQLNTTKEKEREERRKEIKGKEEKQQPNIKVNLLVPIEIEEKKVLRYYLYS